MRQTIIFNDNSKMTNIVAHADQGRRFETFAETDEGRLEK